MIDALAAPLVRELIYPRRGTRVPVEATTYALDVGAATLRGWVVNPGRDRALVYFNSTADSAISPEGFEIRHTVDGKRHAFHVVARAHLRAGQAGRMAPP